MKTTKALLALIVLAVAFSAVRYSGWFATAAGVPTDLRDAVADNGAMDDLVGFAGVSVPEVPTPVPLPGERSAAKAIYGDDDRQDYFEVSQEMRKLSDSVVSLWQSRQVKIDGEIARLETIKSGDALNLCPGQKFREQPIGAFCSGSLVGEDVIMTAGHCITDKASCADAKLVFGYAVTERGKAANTTVPASDVYSCKKVIKRDYDPGTEQVDVMAILNGIPSPVPGPDFAIIKLDRKVEGRAPLAIHRDARPAKGDRLFVIGHPMGLPLKVAGNAKVRENALYKYRIMADLDAFGGNSGSAVFSARTNLIEGILVSGTTGDFAESPAGCNVASQMAQDANGVWVTKISVVEKYIP